MLESLFPESLFPESLFPESLLLLESPVDVAGAVGAVEDDDDDESLESDDGPLREFFALPASVEDFVG